MLLDLIIENKELIKLFYGIIIAVICLIIVLRTHKIFNISLHQGVRYFRNAFLFYGMAFVFRYVFGSFYFVNTQLHYQIAKFLFEFFLVMAGFFLLYSLLWKRIELPGETADSSLFNKNIFLFYLLALIITTIDQMWNTFYLMFFSQISTFIFASIISYVNYMRKGRQRKFLKFYFLAMVLSLITWILNVIASLFFNWDKGLLTQGYILNGIIFLLFLLGVIYFTRRN